MTVHKDLRTRWKAIQRIERPEIFLTLLTQRDCKSDGEDIRE